MNDRRNVLSSAPRKQKQLGLLIMIVGLAGFVASMSYFGIFGKRIEYSGIFLWKEITAFSFLILGLYGTGYAFGGKQMGLSFAKRWTIFSVGAGVLGYFIREFK